MDATPLASGHRQRGIGTYVRHLVQGIAAALPKEAHFLTLGPAIDTIPRDRAVPLAARVPNRWTDLWPWQARSLSRLIRQAGIATFHFTSAETSTKPRGFKTVATVYDLIPYESRPSITLDPRLLWRDRFLYDRYLDSLRAADHVIAISESTASAVRQHLAIPADRVSVIPLGIEADAYRARALRERDSVRGRFGLPERYWLTVTSPNPNKGWPDILQALAINKATPQIPLAIAGYWLPRQRAELDALAGRLGIDHNVRFLGHVSDELLPALYGEALGFIFASHREGFGLPVLEAFAVGTPAIVSDDPAVLEVAGSAAMTFPRGDVAALADRMTTIAADAELRQRLSALGQEGSAAYTWERTVAQTIEVYRALADPHG